MEEEEEEVEEEEKVFFFFFICWLLNVPATCQCISDGSAQTILRAATLR